MAAGEFGTLDCDLCDEQEDLKKIHQCEGGPDRWEILRGSPQMFEIDRCPLTYLDQSIERTTTLHNERERGYYPISGGTLEQIHTGWEALELFGRYLAKMERK